MLIQTSDDRQQQAVEQIMEDERWRAGLTDDEAKVLLDWGIAQVKARLSSTEATTRQAAVPEENDEADAAQLRQLRRAMRAVAYLVEEKQALTADLILEELGPYLPIPSGYKKMFASFISKGVAKQIVQASQNLTNEELIHRLTTFMDTGD